MFLSILKSILVLVPSIINIIYSRHFVLEMSGYYSYRLQYALPAAYTHWANNLLKIVWLH